jgi:DNA processing protein
LPLTTPNPSSLPASTGLWSAPAAWDPLAPHAPASGSGLSGAERATLASHHLTAQDPRFPAALRGRVTDLYGAGEPAAWATLLATLDPASAPGERRLRVTIVGSRAASDVGLGRAFELGQALARSGAIVMSGGALGIDGAAHQGALEGGGQSWAVLGSGLLRPYPRRHLPLFARLAETGLLLSPFPHQAPPRAQHFPRRNQVMAALSDVVVVIEAGLSSGTRYTADAAARLGRPVLCFPGSPGTLALVQGGAGPVGSLAEALDRLGALAQAPQAWTHPEGLPKRVEAQPAARLAAPVPDTASLSPDAARLLSLLGAASSTGRDLSELSALSGLPVASCAAAVIELELSGCCSRLPGGRYMGRASL